MKTTATCSQCGHEFKTIDMIKVKNPKTHYSFMCHDCHRQKYGYYDEVGENLFSERLVLKKVLEVKGFKKSVSKKVSITTGFELEVGYGVDVEPFRVLMDYGYMPTSDSTVQIEYKSPIYRNLNGIAKLLYSVIENGAGSIGNGAGTHVNVWSEDLNKKDFQRIRKYYWSLFKPLYDTVCNDRNNHELFGRNINECGWADGFGNNEHSAFINTEACKADHPRIEFRLCKYENNEQFMNCLKFANECMKTIMINFSNNFMTDNEAIAMGKTPEYATKHNLHKAEITANKLVKVYKKYRGL